MSALIDEENDYPEDDDVLEASPPPLQTLQEEPSDLLDPGEVLVPTNLRADMKATEILLTWGPPQGVRGLMSYEVEWKKKTDSEWTKAVTKDHRYLLKDLPEDTDFDIKVSAYERARKPPPPTPPEEDKEPEEEKNPFEHMTLFPENSTVSQAGSETESYTQRTKELNKILDELEKTLELQKRLNKGEKIPKHLRSKIQMDILKPVRRKNCPKRILLIITNEMFTRSPHLSSAAKVQSEITRLFERDWKVEGDYVRRIKNGTRASILNEIDKLTQRLDFDSHRMFICIILSYGSLEGFRTMDEEMIEYQQLFSLLNGKNWLHFNEKPKFFFIDVKPMKMERHGQYPQDIHVNERSQDELEVTWHPPKAFQNSNLNYLVNCYKVDEQKIHTKIHEVIADTNKCVLDHLEKEVTYKISIWSIQASTQKKKGLPSQTKYKIKEKAEEPKKLRAVSTSYDSITIYWPLPLEGRQAHYYAKYKEKSSPDPFKRTYLLLNESEENQVHILNFLNSNTEYVIKIFAERTKILNEVTAKTLPKHQPKELRAKRVTPFEIELNWEPPNTALRRLYTYTISYRSKNSQVSTVQTKREVYILKDLVPDVVYTIWIAAEKEGLKGDATDPIECHTPRCGPQNLQVDALERQVRVYWDEAVVPSETQSLDYKVCLQNENSRAIEGEVLRTPEAKYEYACYFRDLWTDTNYTLVMTTIIDEGDWDPPTELQIKTRRDPHISDLEPHDNNFLVAYSNTLGIEVGEKKVGGIFLPTLLESLREHYDSKNIVEIMEVVDDEVQNRSAVTGKIKKVITVNTLLARPRF